MKKDIIYIDVDDDITAVIGKIKAAKTAIVALVPPKRSGMLQSAVNIRLIERAAKSSKKHLVIITTNKALMNLAAENKIPVAKNLHSKPEVVEIEKPEKAEVEDDEDVIDGAQLPVGEHAQVVDSDMVEKFEITGMVEDIANDTKDEELEQDPDENKTKVKVPNFDSFRKKLFLGLTIILLVGGFFVWATMFAPKAKIIVSAKTNIFTINEDVELTSDKSTSFKNGLLKTEVKKQENAVKVKFDATGEDFVGDKATGTMTLTRTSISNEQLVVPAGTEFTSAGKTFVSTEAATLAATQVGGSGLIQDTKVVAVEAEEIGEDYNLSARAYATSGSGYSADGNEMKGGSKTKITIITDEDIKKASEGIEDTGEAATRAQLESSVADQYAIIHDSYTAKKGASETLPKKGDPVENGVQAELTVKFTYSIVVVSKSDLTQYLDAALAKEIEGEIGQRIYDNGVSGVAFSDYFAADGKNPGTANVTTTAKIGPDIDEDAVKLGAAGKRYGEVQLSLESISGIEEVNIDFYPFWVRTVPDDVSKISFELSIQE